MGQTSSSSDLKQELHKTLDRMRTLRDEVRVRLHLANLDAKEEWKRLEPHLAEMEQAGEDLRDETRAALNKAIERLSKLRASLAESAPQARPPRAEPPKAQQRH
jgi:DNA repair exonuclease SbcCD ATPase subunit